MPNELLLLVFFIMLAITNLVAFRYGKMYLFILIAVYTLLMNIFVLKSFDVFGLAITGGNALYGAIFLATDLLAEHHGKKEAMKSVIIGFISMLIFVVAMQFLLAFTPNDFDFAQESLSTLFSLAPRILFGSLLAFIIAQSLDIYLFEKIKAFTKGKYLFLRNNGSTLISQALDTLIFTFVGLTTFAGFEGVIGLDIFWEVAIVTYIIKVLVALLDTPFMYLSYKVKK